MRTQTMLEAMLVFCISVVPAWNVLASDEPEPGVARVSLINGEVSTMRGDTGDWVATTVNAPVVQGDKVSTGSRSRAEIQLDHSNILRLDQRTETRIATLSRNRIQVQVSQGLMNFTVLKGGETEVEINTPNVALRPLEEGIYRVQVNSDSETEIICRKGRAEVATPDGSTRIDKNDRIIVQGTSNPEYRVAKAPGRDDWDRWNQDRDNEISDARSYRYANRYYTGAYELDRYGQWDNVPGYGYTWAPYYVDSSWSPYSLGRWNWQPYWGWTWVSYEPWGWAPYHYGRWFAYGGRWRWWPGPVYAGYHPVWAPAYVSFLGFGFGGHNWSFGFGFGYNSIGWLPLGPCDAYYPWYGVRRGHGYNAVNITNVTNVRNITNIYNGSVVPPLADGRTRPYYSNVQSALNNETVRRSVRSLTTEEFVQGRVASRSRTPMDAGTLRQAQLVAGTVPAVPTRDSLRPVDRAVNAASLPSRSAGSERFFTRGQPAATPQSFDQHAAQIRQMVQSYNPQASGRPNSLSPTGSGSSTPVPATAAGSTTRETLTRQTPNRQPAQGIRGSDGAGNTPRSGATSGPSNVTPSLNTRSRAVPFNETPRDGGTLSPSSATTRQQGLGNQRNIQGDSPQLGAPESQASPTADWRRFGIGQPSQRSTSNDSIQLRNRIIGTPGSADVPRAVSNPGVRTNPESSSPVRSAPSSGDRIISQPQRITDTSTPRPEWRRFGGESSAGDRQRTPITRAPWNTPSLSGEGSRSRSTGTSPTEGDLRGTPSRSGIDNRGWNRFPSGAGTTSQTREATQFSRSPRQDMSQPPVSRVSPAPMRQQWPTYRDTQPRMQRPPLQMSKPIVTERAPRSYNSGGFGQSRIERQAPAPQRGSGGSGHSSAPSHSSGNRGRR